MAVKITCMATVGECGDSLSGETFDGLLNAVQPHALSVHQFSAARVNNADWVASCRSKIVKTATRRRSVRTILREESGLVASLALIGMFTTVLVFVVVSLW